MLKRNESKSAAQIKEYQRNGQEKLLEIGHDYTQV